MSFVDDYLRDVKSITGLLDHAVIEKMVDVLIDIRKKKGRLFFLVLVVEPETPAMPLMISGKSPALNRIPPLITSPN